MMTRRSIMAAAAAVAATAAAPAAAAPAAASDRRDPRTMANDLGVRLLGDEQIGMLLYPGFTALDFVGPHHFLAGLFGGQVHLVTNQADLSPVTSDAGLAVRPTVTLEDCPTDLTVLFVPGGTAGTVAAARDRPTVEFVRDRGGRAKYVTSVCTGSLVLGAAGLLQGRRATSHWSVVPLLSRFGAMPERARIVRDGALITGAGVSAGLDFGSALVAELRGRPMAEAAVLMAEYDPEPPIAGGSLQTARPEIAELLTSSLAPFVRDAATLGVL
ncbi:MULTISPECIES: DJ-1/PfpI family protein [unclassified Brevundimonas]|uniref:DJ-1/PfpI family protein n=1 Tax=unclassified Brevundimonas TaxID=2622653 RepID=UPI0025C05738|nr:MULTISPECIES: DJ-1/PfpI family protein [unclassified Brevundimonas]